jgi:hypothetical protein
MWTDLVPSDPAILFRVSFASDMRDEDLQLLVRNLNLVTCMHPGMRNSPASLGVVRLDFDSGLFLLRGATRTEWILEGRSWGAPAPSILHNWHLRATAAATLLDATVQPLPLPSFG